MNYHKRDILLCQDEVLSELYNVRALANATKTYCEVKEFNGEYYGIPKDYVPMISNERNEYISLLSTLSDKINSIKNI